LRFTSWRPDIEIREQASQHPSFRDLLPEPAEKTGTGSCHRFLPYQHEALVKDTTKERFAAPEWS
jgi:hypothetical protein